MKNFLITLVATLALTVSAAATSIDQKPIDEMSIYEFAETMDQCDGAPVDVVFDTAGLVAPGWAPTPLGMTLLALIALCGLAFAVLARQRRWVRRPALVAMTCVVALTVGAVFLEAHRLRTNKGNTIQHSHRPERITERHIEFAEASDAQLIPGTRTVEQPPSTTYDCHGKTFDGTASWINNDQVNQILEDNGYEANPDGGARLGDIVVYHHNGNVTHSGIVTGVDSDGNVTEVCSKWGSGFEYRHKPNEVPQGQSGRVNGQPVTRGTYGTPTVYSNR